MLMKFAVNKADSNETLSQVLEFIHEKMEAMKLASKTRTRAELMCEESLVRLLEHSDFTRIDYISVRIRKFLGNITVDVTVPGKEFDFSESFKEILNLDDDLEQEGYEAIQNILLRLFSENLRYRHSGNFNTVRISAVRSEYSSLYTTFGAIFAAVVTGLLLRIFVPENVYMSLNDNIFNTVRSVFMNGLKACAVPIVFCSIAVCIAEAGNLSGLRKEGMRLLRWIMLGQVIAVIVGFGLVLLLGTGKGAGLTAISASDAGVSGMSVAGTIIGLVSDNLFRSLLDANMLQLIVLAVLVGMAAASSGSQIFSKLTNEVNAIFMKITSYFMLLVPFVIFCSITSLVITTGLETILTLLGFLLTLWGGYALLHIICCTGVKFIAGQSPLPLYKKSLPIIMTALTTGSSSAALPDMMRSADKIGLHPKIYSFGLPLGASINKASYTMYLAVAILTAANMYGINIPISSLMTISLSIIAVTIATPGLPGAGLIAMSVLLSQAGLPLEFIGLIMSVDTIADMVGSPTTCMINLTEEVIVSKLEGELDVEAYNRK